MENLVMSDIVYKYTMDYGKYVINEQFPNYIDGLKIVIRRALWALRKTYPNYVSSQQAISLTTKYHIHSADSTYDALIRLSQDFSVLYPLFKLKGDVGSYSGDSAASFRYTDLKLSDFAHDVYFKNINTASLNFTVTEDLLDIEPTHLIPKIPMALILYNHAIGFGFTSKTLSYKLEDLERIVKVFILYKQNKLTKDKLLIKISKLYPTFPVKNKILNKNNPIVLEGCMNFIKPGRIRIKTLPYTVPFKNMHDALTSNMNLQDEITSVIPASSDANQAEEHIIFKRSPDMYKNMFKTLKKYKFITSLTPFLNYSKDGYLLQVEDDILLLLEHWYHARKRLIINNIKYKISSLKKEIQKLECYLIVADHSKKVEKILKESNDDTDSMYQLKSKFTLTLNQCKILINTRIKVLNKANKTLLKEQVDLKTKELKKTIESLYKIDEKILEDVSVITKKYKRTKNISYHPKYIGYIVIENQFSIWISSIFELKKYYNIFKNKITQIKLISSKEISYGVGYTTAAKEAIYNAPAQYSQNIRYIPKNTIPMIQKVMKYKSNFIEKGVLINKDFITNHFYRYKYKPTLVVNVFLIKNKLYVKLINFKDIKKNSIFVKNISSLNTATYLIMYYISDLKNTIRFKLTKLSEMRTNLPTIFNENTSNVILDVINLDEHTFETIPLELSTVDSKHSTLLLDKKKILNHVEQAHGFKDINIARFKTRS